MLKLKNVLQKAGSKQADLAKSLNVSQATVAQIVNHGEWPKAWMNWTCRSASAPSWLLLASRRPT